MSRVKMSLINNDFVVRAAADLDIGEEQGFRFAEFLDHLREDLGTGESAWLEIEGLRQPVKLSVAESA